MNVPILKQGRILVCSFQDLLTDKELVDLQYELARQVSVHRSKGVIIDITVLDVLDSFAVRTLSNVASILSLRGARTIVAGIQPEVAYAMVQLGLRLEGAETALDLEDALEALADIAIHPMKGSK